MISTPDEYLLQLDGNHIIIVLLHVGTWLNPQLTISEQGIAVTNDKVFVLGKRLHFYDNDIDRSDPIALNLLYVQSRDSILQGTHPVTKEESVQFAALMCQILFGNHDPNKHKKGFVEYVYW